MVDSMSFDKAETIFFSSTDVFLILISFPNNSVSQLVSSDCVSNPAIRTVRDVVVSFPNAGG